MNHGVCPKCQSTEIYRGLSADGEGLTAGSYISLIELITGKTQTTLWLNTYVCQLCGYIEMYIANQDGLAQLSQAEGWERVTTTHNSLLGD